MPHYWNDMLVVTKEELVPDFYRKYDTLKKALKRYEDKPYGIKRAWSGGNGRKLLIKYDSLEKSIQEALGDPRKVANILERYYQIDQEAVKFYSNYYRPGKIYMKPEEQERYIINASVLQAVVKLEQARTTERLNKGGSLRGLVSTLCDDCTQFNDVLKAKFGVEHNLPTSDKRFSTTLREFKENGYYTLIKDPEGKRMKNAAKVNEYVIEILNNLFAGQDHKPYASEVAKQYDAFLSGYVKLTNAETGEEYSPKGLPSLTDRTITEYLRKWENKAGTYTKRSGDRQKLMQDFTPYHSLTPPKFANSLISIDDRQPPFKNLDGKRLWFYNGIDLASGAFVCWVYGDTKEGLILDFYRQLVRNYHEWGFNLPHGLECESSLNSSFKDTFLKPGVMFQDVRIEANRARGKKIEQLYRPLRYQFEKKREGWLARPHARDEANQPGKNNDIKLPNDRIIEESLMDIQTWQNTASLQDEQRSKWDYFCEMQQQNLEPTNYVALLPHLGYRTKTSCNVGIIKFNRQEWLLGENGRLATGEALINLMKRVEGKDVDIYWLDANDGSVLKALVFVDGRYICEAVSKPTYNRASIERTPADEMARTLMASYVATIESFRKDRTHSLDPIHIEDKRPKTISNSFVMPELTSKPRTARVEEAEEVLVDDEPLYDTPTETTKGRSVLSWRDKFN